MKRRCTCYMKTDLIQTGWGEPHADWICPSCGRDWWSTVTGEMSPERPFQWPSKKVEPEADIEEPF